MWKGWRLTVLEYRLFVIAMGCHFVFPAMLHLHTGFPHQASSFPATNPITQRIQRFSDSAATITIIAGFCYIPNHFKYFLVTPAFRTIINAPNVIIVGATTYTHELAHQANRIGLFPLGNERILHFVSFAKKTVASFSISLSSLSCLICAFNCRISSCSGVSFPLPRND